MKTICLWTVVAITLASVYIKVSMNGSNIRLDISTTTAPSFSD